MTGFLLCCGVILGIMANRVEWPRPMAERIDLTDLAARIPDGCSLGLPPDYSLVSMAAVRELVRRKARGLHLIAAPTAGFAADLLIGAGAVDSIEAAAASLGEFGAAPRFTAALRRGTLRMKDATCPAIHAGLQAAEKGVPFLPLRGLIGSDLLRVRPEWRVVDNPFGNDDPIVLLPALIPDVAVFHARWADASGNLWIGRQRELATLAHAARRSLVTVEEVVDDLFADEVRAAGVLPALYVEAYAVAPGGAKPLGLPECYPRDDAELQAYAEAAATDEGFARYLERFVWGEEVRRRA